MLMAFAGDLGQGKTVSLTYFALLAWLNGERVYSNYRLYGIPYTPVHDLEQLDNMTSGFFAADELWLWADSRVSTSNKNKAIGKILLKSRKRGLTIGMTAQGMHQLDRRIRLVCDITMFPQMLDEFTIKLRCFKQGKPIGIPLYYNPTTIYPFYDTTEEIFDIEPSGNPTGEVFFPITENKAWDAFLTLRRILAPNKKKINMLIAKELKSVNPVFSA